MLALVAFLTLVALAIPVEHLAFSRHPRLMSNEVARRAVGIGTVMPVSYTHLTLPTNREV